MDYIIGIDAGGTKTTAAAYSTNGEVLNQAVTGFGNPTIDFDRGMGNICDALDKLIEMQKACGYSNPIRIVLGCAGIETGDKKQMAYEYLSGRYGSAVLVTNDAMLALYAAHHGEDGILIIAGTGSIGYLKQGGEVKRFGGWGHLINDDGSGYSIVIKAIRYIAYSFDTNNSDTVLKKAVFEKLCITRLSELIDFTYKSTKGEIAALVPVIERAANNGDMQARSILSWAGERLAYLVIGLCSQYNVLKPRVALSGSVIKKTELVKKSFCDILNSELQGYTLYENDFNPSSGAVYIDSL